MSLFWAVGLPVVVQARLGRNHRWISFRTTVRMAAAHSASLTLNTAKLRCLCQAPLLKSEEQGEHLSTSSQDSDTSRGVKQPSRQKNQFEVLGPAVGAGDADQEQSLADRVAVLSASFATDDDWMESPVGFSGIRCSFRTAPGGNSGIVSVRAEAEVDAPLFDVLSMFYEVDLWQRWTPSFGSLGLQSASLLGAENPLCMVYGLEANLPWPFRRRSCRFAVEAVDGIALDEGHQHITILMDSRRVSAVCSDLPCTDAAGEDVVAEVFESGFVLIPPEVRGTKGTLIQGVLNVDPHIRIPDWIVAFAATNLCQLVMRQFQHAERITRTDAFLARSCDPENEFYTHVRRRMEESLPTQLARAPRVRDSSHGVS